MKRKVYDRHLKSYIEKTALEETVFTYNNGRIEKVSDEELESFIIVNSLAESMNEFSRASMLLRNITPVSVKDNVRLSDVYRKVIDFLKKRVDLPSEADYTLVALWVIGSYFFPVFDYFPYLSTQKMGFNSGGTQFLFALMDLLPRAMYTHNVSPSTIYTAVSQYRASLLIDELREEVSEEYRDAIIQLLSGCNSRWGRVARTEITKGGRRTIAGYECFSPKAFVDQSLIMSKYDIASRSVFVRILPSQNRRSDYAIEDNQSLIDELYSVFLRYASEVDRLYRDPDVDSGFTGRYDQTFRPLVIIARLIDMEDSTLQAEDKLRSALEFTIELIESLKVEGDPQKKVINLVKDYIVESLKDVVEGATTVVPRPWHAHTDLPNAFYIFVSDLRKEVRIRAMEVTQRDISIRPSPEGDGVFGEREWYRIDPEIARLLEGKEFVALLKKFFPKNVKTHRNRPVFIITSDDVLSLAGQGRPDSQEPLSPTSEAEPNTETQATTQSQGDVNQGTGEGQDRGTRTDSPPEVNPTTQEDDLTPRLQHAVELLRKLSKKHESKMSLKKLTREELSLLPEMKEKGYINYNDKWVWLTLEGYFFLQKYGGTENADKPTKTTTQEERPRAESPQATEPVKEEPKEEKPKTEKKKGAKSKRTKKGKKKARKEEQEKVGEQEPEQRRKKAKNGAKKEEELPPTEIEHYSPKPNLDELYTSMPTVKKLVEEGKFTEEDAEKTYEVWTSMRAILMQASYLWYGYVEPVLKRAGVPEEEREKAFYEIAGHYYRFYGRDEIFNPESPLLKSVPDLNEVTLFKRLVEEGKLSEKDMMTITEVLMGMKRSCVQVSYLWYNSMDRLLQKKGMPEEEREKLFYEMTKPFCRMFKKEEIFPKEYLEGMR